MADDRIEIVIELDDGSVRKGLATVERESRRAGRRIGENLERGFNRVFRAITDLRFQLIGVAGAFGLAFGGREILAAAQAQEDAVNNLNQSLINAGRFSQEASQQFQAFASNLQSVTTIGDEAALELLGLANTFARSNEEAQQLVQTAADLSAATGISLEGAVRNLGKTFSGLTGELGEAVPAVRELTAEQLKAGEAITVLGERFAGAAAAQVRTFSGQLTQVTNLFGDLLEEIGFIVTQSPQAVALLGRLGEAIQGAITSLSELRESRNILTEVLIGLADFAEGVNRFVVIPIEAIVDTTEIAFRGILTLLSGFVAGAAQLLSKFASFFAPDSEAAQSLKLFSEASTSALNQFASETSEAVEQSFGFEASNAIEGFINTFRVAVEETSVGGQKIVENINNTGQGVKDSLAANSKAISGIIQNGIVNVVSAGIQTLGAALVTGGKAFDNFAKTALGIIGDFAIQLGTTIIASGTAIDALKASLIGFFGGAAIAAGIALVAIGGALKSLAGGGASAPVTGGGGVGAGQVVGEPTELAPTEDIENVGPQVNIQVDGALDAKGVATQIRDILQDSFDADGGNFTFGAV